MISEWIKHKINKYGKEKLITEGIVMVETERPIKTLDQFVMQFCERNICKNCPVLLNDCDTRSEQDRENGELCVTSLFDWVIDEAKKHKKNRE